MGARCTLPQGSAEQGLGVQGWRSLEWVGALSLLQSEEKQQRPTLAISQ